MGEGVGGGERERERERERDGEREEKLFSSHLHTQKKREYTIVTYCQRSVLARRRWRVGDDQASDKREVLRTEVSSEVAVL